MTIGSFLFCSYEYEREKSCLKTHVATCMSSFVVQVTSLLLHQLYHCGDLTYQPSNANKFILERIKCKDEAFMDTDFCWEYFRDKLNSNRSDPSLCRWDLGWLRWCHCIFFFRVVFPYHSDRQTLIPMLCSFSNTPPPQRSEGRRRNNLEKEVYLHAFFWDPNLQPIFTIKHLWLTFRRLILIQDHWNTTFLFCIFFLLVYYSFHLSHLYSIFLLSNVLVLHLPLLTWHL